MEDLLAKLLPLGLSWIWQGSAQSRYDVQNFMLSGDVCFWACLAKFLNSGFAPSENDLVQADFRSRSRIEIEAPSMAAWFISSLQNTLPELLTLHTEKRCES